MDFTLMLSYCAELARHNERPWFHETHAWYETARADYCTLLDLLRTVIAEEAPDVGRDILPMQPKDWVYRVARDMRFHHNGPPYDPSFRAYMAADRKSWRPIGYFLRIAPGSSCFGTGMWLFDSARIHAVRDDIVTNWPDFETALRAADLPLEGDCLKKMPRGFEQYADHPAAPWLKYKNWSVIEYIPDSELTDFDTFGETVRGLVRRMEPLRRYLLQASYHVPDTLQQNPTPKDKSVKDMW